MGTEADPDAKSPEGGAQAPAKPSAEQAVPPTRGTEPAETPRAESRSDPFDGFSGLPRLGALIADKYLLERVIGAGGMGTVIAARHVQLGQRVAIKMLRHDSVRDPESVARFLREGRTVASLKSTHVVRVMDIGTFDGAVPYMVMEYLTGTDLKTMLHERGALNIDEAVDYVLEAMEAIAEAHQVGLVHRDLKPANLFVATQPDGTGLVKVLDFGLSKVKSSAEIDQSLTATSAILGSPKYMPPEQLRSPKTVDARADIWALGTILYELVTGRTPFEAETFSALCAKIAADPPTPLSEHRPDLPPAFEAVVMTCLEKDPAERPQTVGQLASALRPFAQTAAQAVDSILRIEALHPIRASGPPKPLSTRESGRPPRTGDFFAIEQSLAGRKRRQKRALMVVGPLGASAIGALFFYKAHTSAFTPPVPPPPSPAVGAAAPQPELTTAPAASAPSAPVNAGHDIAKPSDTLQATTAADSAVATEAPPATSAKARRPHIAAPAHGAAPPKASASAPPRDVLLDRK